ncbi:putative class III heat-shock ATP-dependent Lon protease [Actinoplanes missouriensis 431]|uniref:Lon protease n=1 Tax=Actinoplanes missouriensis (strain ATCC 14538 / DSM 43046 / CBS 188.64 / JCM 3121 / NBRC 102363 / NCIMB 12654 / NRRL B-3342 / UNCC 431) TaxID=512565 RepID=I0HB18_ACTM4|nr:endopeptidase La [Actinoplanes missouriensis]BAL90205.1 putative class III heat-shock ATP-dependent Lon protease [Actinoplanes missouriensis 431]
MVEPRVLNSSEVPVTSKRLPVLFLDDIVLLPGMAAPVELDEKAQAAVDAARTSAGSELLIAPRLEDRYASYGVVATVEQVGKFRGGTPAAVLRTGVRAKIGSGVTGPGAALWVEAEPVPVSKPSAATRELAAEYKKLVVSVLQRREAWQVIDSVSAIDDPGDLADTAGWAPYLSSDRKRELLETPDVEARLRLLIDWTRDFLAESEVSEKIEHDVRESVEKRNREYLLREQLKAIRKELGEGEADDKDDYRARVEAADLPDAVREAALREVEKLERAGDQNPEAGWIRSWLDTVLDLPWAVRTTDSTDLEAARAVLDTDHHGLDEVKERIVEYLGVRARRESRGLTTVGGRGSGAVILLAGPPGVGKTSLGESVAKTLSRKFVRVALGGVRDEAEIRGHRRTYVGALPGRIVRAIREAGTMNPVVLLDEVDKVGSDYRGDPAAALLEVLDPAQNHTFRDHYLDLDLDLSDVLFIATANTLETIPQALFDRMELITIDGYTANDKVAIARDFLLPRQIERAALSPGEVTVTEDALRLIAADYTREAGVRSFERLLAKALRKVALGTLPATVDAADLKDLIGRPRFTPDAAERTAVPGVSTGLAVTGMGGDVLYIEASLLPGDKGGLSVTGQLGDVMKESAQIAISYVRAHAGELGISPEQLDHPIHLHVPAGAVPKDGPSAGVTMTTALVSLLLGRTVRAEVGMTGEVSLTGRVLPIGGVKQKLLAAQRAGLTEVYLPQRNEPDLDDVPADVLDALTVHIVSDVREILDTALDDVLVAA